MNASSQVNRRGAQAFTLVEIVGVVAVIVILTLAVMPSLLKQLDRLAKEKEMLALQAISGGLQSYILTPPTNQAHRIPSTNTFFQDVAGEMGWLLSEVRTNARANPRVYLLNPSLRIGTNSSQVLPYTQGIYGSIDPISPQAMIISSMGAALPTMIVNPSASYKQLVFDMLFNSTDDTTPAGWTWGGNFEDIKIQRVTFDPLFAQVSLNNNSATMGRFSIDNSSHVALPGTNFTAYYLKGTVLGLHSTDGTLQAKQILQEDCAYWYDNGVWRGQLPKNANTLRHTGADLQAAYDIFMSAPANPNAKSGSPGQCTTDMWLYMSNYVYWSHSGASLASPPAYLQQAATTMGSDLKNYIWKSGN